MNFKSKNLACIQGKENLTFTCEFNYLRPSSKTELYPLGKSTLIITCNDKKKIIPKLTIRLNKYIVQHQYQFHKYEMSSRYNLDYPFGDKLFLRGWRIK
jgi:hypothetical protein